MLGNMLRERDQQYVATRDDATNTWRILDSWSDALKELDVDDDIPDDSSAVKILSEGEFIAVVKEAARLGILQNVPSGSTEEDEEILTEASDKIDVLTQDLEEARRKLNAVEAHPPRSEQFELKELALQTVLKLTALSEVEMLTSKDM
jgi:hypothetical protein|tara:strand:- start:34 stop:477 length:444 start_codon:yes stop_codon:yes gene_type:complete